MSEFSKKVNGDSVKVKPEDVREIKRVNSAVTDLELSSGETIRVEGSYEEVRERLGQVVKPEGLEKLDYDWRKDKKLKHFVS